MEADATTRKCPQCGAALPPDAPQGLCPQCLLKNGLLSAGSAANTTPTFGQSVGASRPTAYRTAGRFVPPSVEHLSPYFPQLEILELLGQGGMGAVYKAKQRGLDRLVAVKILPPDLGDIPGFADRFTREARALARLNHPNIVSVYDFGRTRPMSGTSGLFGQGAEAPAPDGLYFLVMEYVDGVNLRQAMRTNKLSPAEALAIVPQICEALQFAHDEGIVHRDIKPENILLDKRGKVKIADFGLAKLIAHPADDVTLTREGGTMGTPHYMAPEQIEGAHEVDHRADIYSLGVVFYEMLTGELPLGRFAAPSKKVHIDVRLDDIVLRSLEKEPELRYQHASEMKTQVDGLRGMSPAVLERALGREYRSQATLFGLPLVHIAFGIDPKTGRKRVAKGIIAIGDVAKGVIAFGGVAMGGIAMGGIALGVISFGGLSLGLLLAIGGLAIGAAAFGGMAAGIVAVGGGAVGVYAYGGGAFGAHVWAGQVKDAEAVRLFDGWVDAWPGWLTVLAVGIPFIGALVGLVSWLVLRSAGSIDSPPSRGRSGPGGRQRSASRSEGAAEQSIASGADDINAVRREVSGPAIVLCMATSLLILLALFCFTNGLDIADGNDATPAAQGYLLLGGATLLLVMAGLVARGAWHIFSLCRRGPAVLAGFLGLPLGLWALVVLTRRHVAAAFEEQPTRHIESARSDTPADDRSGFVCAVLAVIFFLLGLIVPLILVAGWPNRPMALPIATFGVGHLLAIFFGVAGHRHRLGRFTAFFALIIGLGIPAFFFLWSSPSGRPEGRQSFSSGSIKYFEGHSSIVKAVAVSRDGKTLASAGMDGRLIVRDLSTGQVRHTVQTSDVVRDRPDTPLYSVTFSPGDEVLAGGNPESVNVLKLSLRNHSVDAVSAPTRGSVRGLMTFNQGRKFAYVAGDTEVVFYDPTEGRAVARAPIYPGKEFGNVRAIAGSPDGRFIAVTSSNMTGSATSGYASIEPCHLTVYENNGDERLSWRLDSYADFSYAQIVFADSRTLIACLPSGRMLRWELQNDDVWAYVASPRIDAGQYTAIAAQRDGKVIWLAQEDHIVGYDAKTGEALAFTQLEIGKRAKNFASFPIEALAATGDDWTVAAALWDGRVAVARCARLEGNDDVRPVNPRRDQTTGPEASLTESPVQPVQSSPRAHGVLDFRIAVSPDAGGPEAAPLDLIAIKKDFEQNGPFAAWQRGGALQWFECDPAAAGDLITATHRGKTYALLHAWAPHVMLWSRPPSSEIPRKGDGHWAFTSVDTTRDEKAKEQRFNVHFTLDRFGKEMFADLTKQHIGQRLAIVIGGRVVSAPKIVEAVTDGTAMAVNLTLEEANRLTGMMKGGMVPREPTKVDEQKPK